MLHSSDCNIGRIEGGSRQFKGEGLIKYRVLILLHHLRFFSFDSLVLDHKLHFHIGICDEVKYVY